jgi:chromosome segregation ATPase
MRRLLISCLFIVVAFSSLVSCETTKTLKGSITSKVSSITSSVDENLFAQVPEHEKHNVDKAALALMVSEGKVKLAEMKTELANLQKKYARYEENLAKKLQKEAALSLDIAKLEAIDRSDLGEKDDNAKKIADLRSKKLGIEAQRVKIEAQLATANRQISGLTKQIEEQAKEIEELETGKEQKQKEIESPETGEGELNQ